MGTVGLFGDLGDESVCLSVGGCLPVLSPVLGGSASTAFIVRLLLSRATVLAIPVSHRLL